MLALQLKTALTKRQNKITACGRRVAACGRPCKTNIPLGMEALADETGNPEDE